MQYIFSSSTVHCSHELYTYTKDDDDDDDRGSSNAKFKSMNYASINNQNITKCTLQLTTKPLIFFLNEIFIQPTYRDRHDKKTYIVLLFNGILSIYFKI